MGEHSDIRKHAIELNKNLQKRPTLVQLANNGIYPPLNGPVRYSNERRKLIMAQTKDFLQHKFEQRPPRTQLEKQSILIASQRFDPLVSQRVPQLRRSFLKTNLNVKLKERPGPLELVAGNILKPDDDMLLHLNSEELCTEPVQECKQVKLHCSKVLSTKCAKNGMKFYYYDGVLVDKKNINRSKPQTQSGYMGALEQQRIYLNEAQPSPGQITRDSGVGLCVQDDSELTKQISYFMNNYTVVELKEELKQRSCTVSGKKLDLSRRLARSSLNALSTPVCSPAMAIDQSFDDMPYIEMLPQWGNSSIGDVPIYNSRVATDDRSQWYF